MDVSKAYNETVPEFLRNRPKLFVGHCIWRMPPKVGALASEDFLQSDCCTVASADSGEMCTMSFQEMYPNCSCPDFQKKYWPCKHLLGVISFFPNYSWDHLNFMYTDQVCFIIDHSVGIDNTVSTENIQTDADLHVYESEHSYDVPAEHGSEKGSTRNKMSLGM